MNIWVPKIKILENSDALIVPQHGVGGLFRITGRLPDGRQRVLAEWQKNLITDGGLNRWGTGNPFGYCALGSGTTPPTVLDTNLVAFQRQNNTTINAAYGRNSVSPYYGWRRWDFVFNPPGVNLAIAEIGIGWAPSGVNLFSRALIKDVNGDPLVLNWLAAETLTVTYEVRMYPWEADVPHTTVISGTTYTGIKRPSRIADGSYSSVCASAQSASSTVGAPNFATSSVYSGTIGAITAAPGGSSAGPSPRVDNAYANLSLEATSQLTFGATVANFVSGVASLLNYTTTVPWQISFNPAIPKSNLQTLTLNVSSGVWGRQP